MKLFFSHFLRLIILLVLVAAGTFILLSFSPVDPIRAYIGNDLLHVPPEQYARIAARWGLDQPLWERFGHWFWRLLQGDMGYSMLFNMPVANVIRERFATSFALLAGAWLLSGVLGVTLGFLAGRFLYRWPDKMICRISYLLSSLPTFWIAMLLLALFAVRWPVLPVCCAWDPGNNAGTALLSERLRHLVLPVCALSLLGMGQIALHTREKIASVMKSEFIRFARAQGDKGWSLLRHQVLRHAITPALCLQFASLGELMGGALLAEKVFAYPGLGQATIDAGLRGDVPLLMFRLILSVTCLLFIAGYGYATLSQPPEVNLLARHLSPDIQHWFGTDNLGRDVWLRCFQGAFTSLQIGVGAALCSGVIALVMAAVARIHPRLDLLMRLITDAMLAMPHLLLLILICFTLGGGKSGVIAAVALTHWPRLALILRADAERVAQSDYLTLTYRLGHGHLYCWRYHYFPALLPQWLTGTLLMFPHAVLHSAALSFLGFGLAPHEPSLGLLLADALRFISHGNWWLVLFPGLMLFTLVMLFDQFARAIQRLWLRSDVC